MSEMLVLVEKQSPGLVLYKNCSKKFREVTRNTWARASFLNKVAVCIHVSLLEKHFGKGVFL